MKNPFSSLRRSKKKTKSRQQAYSEGSVSGSPPNHTISTPPNATSSASALDYNSDAGLFLSYSRRDYEVVRRIQQDLEGANFLTWMDQDRIQGGAEWEMAIEVAIENSSAFLVFVSEASNASNWVRRETIKADQLKKLRIPLLLDCELPFRLLELQYIDFRGSYTEALSELVQVLKVNNLEQVDSATSIVGTMEPTFEEDTAQQIGMSVLAMMRGDKATADIMIQKAIAITQSYLQIKMNFGPNCDRRSMQRNTM